MLAGLSLLAGALGTGFASALVPVVNAEAAVVAFAALSSHALVVSAVVSLTLGHTVGKVVLYEAARAGRRQVERRTPDDAPPRFPRLARLADRLLASLDGRWRTIGIVLLSASVGLPPLLAVALAAGAVRMRRLDFAACVFVGRLVRFGVIAAPVLAAR